jgi:hypothetical protein
MASTAQSQIGTAETNGRYVQLIQILTNDHPHSQHIILPILPSSKIAGRSDLTTRQTWIPTPPTPTIRTGRAVLPGRIIRSSSTLRPTPTIHRPPATL